MENTKKPENPPVFPVSPDESKGKVSSVHGGMSLRDYFAAKAMNALLTSAWQARYIAAIKGVQPNTEDWTTEAEVAKQAYEVADAMLAERGKE